MIVDSMTHEEVYAELERDREAMTNWWKHNLEKQRRRVLKNTSFPLNMSFEHTSPRKVRYIFFTHIFDKHMKHMMTGVVALRQTSEGLTVYTDWLSYQKLIKPMIFLPHVWKRYKDPKRGNVQKQGVDLITHYFLHNPHGSDSHNQKAVGRSVRYNGEEHLALCVNDGVLLGQMQGDIYVVHTFITYEMTSGLQQKEFGERREEILTDRELHDYAKMLY